MIKISKINITNMRHGWLDLSIGDRTFTVSYLTDVINELKDLFEFDVEEINPRPKRIYFDGEGKELYLISWMDLDHIVIVWEEYSDEDKCKLYTHRFVYKELITEFNALWEKIEKDYCENFDLENILGN